MIETDSESSSQTRPKYEVSSDLEVNSVGYYFFEIFIKNWNAQKTLLEPWWPTLSNQLQILRTG